MGDIQDDEEVQMYSQEEINQAREDLKEMHPEDLLSLRGALDRAMANISLPEAVAIVFTEVYTESGNKVNITCRGVNAEQALDELANALRYADKKYNMHLSRSQPTTPQVPVYVQDAQETAQASNIKVVDIDVSGITRERKKDGKGDFLRVKGGVFTKYGSPAYDNVFPKTFDITRLTYGVETYPMVGMTHARVQAEVDQDGKMSHTRVLGFS